MAVRLAAEVLRRPASARESGFVTRSPPSRAIATARLELLARHPRAAYAQAKSALRGGALPGEMMAAVHARSARPNVDGRGRRDRDGVQATRKGRVMEAGFVGLGAMGQGMARSLLRAGHRLSVWNRTRERAEALSADGAAVASTPAEAARAGVVFSMVSDDRDRLLLETGERLAVPLPLASLVRDRMLAAMARGYGDQDWSAFARIAVEEAGLARGGQAQAG